MNQAPSGKRGRPSRDVSDLGHRHGRWSVTAIGGVCLIAAVVIRYWGGGAGTAFVSQSLIRIALVMLAVAFAWESLKRPASWLPPGAAGMLLIGLAVLAARPKLVVVVVPLISGLVVLTGLVRGFGRSRS